WWKVFSFSASCSNRCSFSTVVHRAAESGAQCTPVARSAAEAELADDAAVALDIVRADVIEQPTPPTHEHKQPAPAVVILLVHLEVLGEVVDPLGEERDLNLGRAGVGVVQAVLGDDPRLRLVDLFGHAVVSWKGCGHRTQPQRREAVAAATRSGRERPRSVDAG